MRLLLFDCDSTLSAIEGIDELAQLADPAVARAVAEMTHAAMEGAVSVEEVFARRLELIRPTRAMVEEIGRRYLDHIEPTAETALARTRELGWTNVIVSGGFRQAIAPLAARLGIARVEAVDLIFDDAGAYVGFDTGFPTARSGGKAEVVRALRAELDPECVVMVGDGVSDLETAPEVDRFVGFGRFARRERVRAGTRWFIDALADLPPLLPEN
jgi:phosphoserine phosphatase